MSSDGCRVLFVGAVEEGRRCLDALVARGERFCGIVTLKESLAAKTSGAVAFDDIAARLNVPLLKVADLNSEANVRKVAELSADLILVIGWTRLLGPALLKLPPLGCVGFHASLLPRYRGRAPVNWALIHGETETGNTMFFLDEGVDTGDIIAQRRIAITGEDDCRTLYQKVSDAATQMLLENLPLLKIGEAPRAAQDHQLATVMPKRTPEEGVIDWTRTAADLNNWVRALTHPYPGAFTHMNGRRLFIWKARVIPATGPAAEPDSGKPGSVVGADGEDLLVTTGRGTLGVRSAQWEGGEEMAGAALAGLKGSRFEMTRRDR